MKNDDNFPGLDVDPGEIRVNYGLLVVDEPRAKVWEIDLHSKYSEVLSYGTNLAGEPEVLLAAGERTLRTDDACPGIPTRIILVGLDGAGPHGWNWLAEAGRYTVRIAAYRPAYPGDLEGEG